MWGSALVLVGEEIDLCKTDVEFEGSVSATKKLTELISKLLTDGN